MFRIWLSLKATRNPIDGWLKISTSSFADGGVCSIGSSDVGDWLLSVSVDRSAVKELQWQSSAIIYCHHSASGSNHPTTIPDHRSTRWSFLQLDLAIGDQRAITMIIISAHLLEKYLYPVEKEVSLKSEVCWRRIQAICATIIGIVSYYRVWYSLYTTLLLHIWE